MHLGPLEVSVPFCEDATGLRDCVGQRVHGGFPLIFLPAFLPHSAFLTHMGDKAEELAGAVKVVLTERSQGPRSQAVQNEQKKTRMAKFPSSYRLTCSYPATEDSQQPREKNIFREGTVSNANERSSNSSITSFGFGRWRLWGTC